MARVTRNKRRQATSANHVVKTINHKESNNMSKYDQDEFKEPMIKKFLHVVDLNVKDVFVKIDEDQNEIMNDCSKMNHVSEYYNSNNDQVITDQPCQITETNCNPPVTPHRIKLDSKLYGNIVEKSKKDKHCNNHTITEYFPVRRSNRKTKNTVLQEKKKRFIDAIKSDIEEGLAVCYFESKGRGVVATQEFKRGDFVVEYRGDLIDDMEAKQREQYYARDNNAGCYMYYFKHKNKQYCVDATAETNYLGRLVNHSRNGNLIPRLEEIAGTPHLVLIAKDDINVGQELTYDYGDRSKESLIHHPWLAR